MCPFTSFLLVGWLDRYLCPSLRVLIWARRKYLQHVTSRGRCGRSSAISSDCVWRLYKQPRLSWSHRQTLPLLQRLSQVPQPIPLRITIWCTCSVSQCSPLTTINRSILFLCGARVLTTFLYIIIALVHVSRNLVYSPRNGRKPGVLIAVRVPCVRNEMSYSKNCK